MSKQIENLAEEFSIFYKRGYMDRMSETAGYRGVEMSNAELGPSLPVKFIPPSEM